MSPNLLPAMVAVALQIPELLMPPRPPITDPMFAASPRRELRRQWDDCTWRMVEVMVGNHRGQEEATKWVFAACADAESLLTGEMVRQFGYSRGTEAMQRARNEVVATIRSRIAPSRPALPRVVPGYIRSVSGWQIARHDPMMCLALREEIDVPGSPATIITATPRARVIEFQVTSTAQGSVSTLAGHMLRLDVVALSRTGERTDLGEMRFVVGSFDIRSLSFTTILADGASIRLRQSERIELSYRDPSTGHSSPLPSFPIAGSSQALEAVLECLRQ